MKLSMASSLLLLAQISYASYEYEMSSVNIPEEARPTSMDTHAFAEEIKQAKKIGYFDKKSIKYEYLSNIENRVKFSKDGYKKTHLAKNLSDINIISTLKTVPHQAKAYTLGYEAISSYTPEGWTGVTEIFKSKNIGICQFSHVDLRASNGAYSLSKKDDRRDVNGKYTAIKITGKKNEGFDYEVNWFEDLNIYTLSCINIEYSTEFTKNVIALAKQIDSGI